MHLERGAVNILLAPLILAIIFFLSAIGFGVWAYQGRQDYKNNVDAKVATAVTAAKQDESVIKDKEFAEASKNPLKTYTGPAAYGTVKVQYPRTWSAYISDTTNSDPYVNGYFFPDVVPDTSNQNTVFALRVQVAQQSYSDVLKGFQSLVQSGKVTVSAYALPKQPSIVGSRVDGQIVNNKSGSMILLPLRDKTLKVWTEAAQFEPDFNNNILPNLTFSP